MSKAVFVNGGMTVASILLSLLLAEFFFRAYIGDRGERVQYFSSRALVAGLGGAMHYQPLSRVRSKAVYDGVVEFDVTFPTNNLGYIDSIDYHRVPADRAVAVVGDSFTAGYHGGEPWVPKLRAIPELKGRMVYNLGVDGVGTKAFLASLRRVESRLAFDTVLMIGISPDFTRPLLRPLERDGLLWLCPTDQTDEQCLATPTDLRALDPASPPTQEPAHLPGKSPLDFLRGIVRAVFPSLSSLQRNLRASLRLTAELPEAAAQTFADFRQWGGDRTLVFLHIPLRDEAERQAFLTPLQEIAKAHGIRYVSGLECGFTVKDYMTRDMHPNAAGYDRIRACASAALQSALN